MYELKIVINYWEYNRAIILTIDGPFKNENRTSKLSS